MDQPAPTRPHRPSAAGRHLLLALACLGLGACASRPGHYYQDDGPPDHPPAGLAQTPDAVPRVEPLNPRANRPYAALGRTYTPDTSDAPFEQRGMASWYGRQYQGNPTASGEPYDMYAMSAAHPTLPIPSYARVTRVNDGRSVIVRINDRGPFLQDRIIDLSYAAATRLGIVGPGSAEVSVRKITARDIAAGNYGPPVSTVAAAPAAASLPKPQAPIVQAPALPTEAAIQSRVVASADSPAPPEEPAMALPAPAGPAEASAAGTPAVAVAAPIVTTPPVEATAVVAEGARGAVPPATAAPVAAEAPAPAAPAVPAATDIPDAAEKGAPPVATTAATAAAPSPAPAVAATPGSATTALPATPSAGSPAATAAPAGKADAAAGGKGKWAVQVGAFAQLANAEALRDRVGAALARPEAGNVPAEGRQPRIAFDGRLHHVLIGSFDARSAAQKSARVLRQLLAQETTLYRE